MTETRRSNLAQLHSMQVNSWGPSAWNFANAVALNAPESIPYSKRGIYKSFFVDNFKALLPCSFCRLSFVEYSDAVPIEAFYDTRAGLAVFLYKIHSLVNKKLDKQDITFFEYIKKVESMRAKCSKTGAKGCTEPHIQKNGAMCQKWADSAWDRYGNLDIAAWKRQRTVYHFFFWTLGVLAVILILKFLLRAIIRCRSNKIIKLLS